MFETLEDRVTTQFCELRGIHPTLEDALGIDLEAEGWEKIDFEKGYPLQPHESVLGMHYGRKIYRSDDRWMCVSELDRRNRLYVVLEAPDQGGPSFRQGPNAYYFKIDKCVVADRHGNYWNAIDEMDPESKAYLALDSEAGMRSGDYYLPATKDLFLGGLQTWVDIASLLHEVGHQRMHYAYNSDQFDVSSRAIALYRKSILRFSRYGRFKAVEEIDILEEQFGLSLLDAMKIVYANERAAARFELLSLSNLTDIYKINKREILEIYDRISSSLLKHDIIPIPYNSASYEFRSLPLELQKTYLRLYTLLRTYYEEYTRISEFDNLTGDEEEGLYEFEIDGKKIELSFLGETIYIQLEDRRFGSFELKKYDFSLEQFSVSRTGLRPRTGIRHRNPVVKSFDVIDFRSPELLRVAYKDGRFALLLESLDLLDLILPNLKLIGEQANPPIDQDAM